MLKSLTGVILCASMMAMAAGQSLHVYGPGGPLAPMKECAELYQQKTGVKVQVTAGPEKAWIDSAQTDADVVFGGAEYMLTQFDLEHKGFLRGRAQSRQKEKQTHGTNTRSGEAAPRAESV